MLKLVLSATEALVEKARMARRRADGAVPPAGDADPMAPAMPVPCACGFSSDAGGVVALRDDAGEIRMVGVDFGIDHRDRNIGALIGAVEVRQAPAC